MQIIFSVLSRQYVHFRLLFFEILINYLLTINTNCYYRPTLGFVPLASFISVTAGRSGRPVRLAIGVIFYEPDVLPFTQPTAILQHWRD